MACYAQLFSVEASVMLADLIVVAGKITAGGAFYEKMRRVISEMGMEPGVEEGFCEEDGIDVSIPFMLL